jgi:ferredoxin
MVKDEDVCLHCGLCAERCPTAAWDMRQSDVLIPYAGDAGDAGHGARGAGHETPPALGPSEGSFPRPAPRTPRP